MCRQPPPVFPLILLYNFQFLSEHALRVSPSLIDVISRESVGFGTQLKVTNLTPKPLISSSHPWMDPLSKPSNHFIVVGLRLEGKNLHIRASFMEYIAML